VSDQLEGGFAERIVEALSAHICVVDATGRILFVNEAWRRFGRENPPVPHHYFVGDSYLAVCESAVGPVSAEAAPFAAGLRALQRGETDLFALEYPCHAPGIERWFLVRATRLAGDPVRVVIAHEDISARRRVELALCESEALMRALFENSLASVLLTAPEGRVFKANPAACRLLGASEREICERGRVGLVDESDPRVAVLLRARALTGEATGEITMRRADGTLFPVLVSSALFETRQGVWTATVIQDVTEMRQNEERVRAFSRRLLSVREDEKRRLSAALHHDVGSLTVSVAARMAAAEEAARRGRAEEALKALRGCQRVFARSVKDLRRLAVDLRPPDLDVLGLSAALRQHVERLGGETALRVRFTDCTRGVAIDAESQTVLFRAAQEGLNNVVKHAEARGARVRLAVAGPCIKLRVSDDGRGFDPTGVAAEAGAHLGLRAVREMVAALGGQATIVSGVGSGTTLEVAIPLGGGRA
jgi:PAS domain S-box-containing protein